MHATTTTPIANATAMPRDIPPADHYWFTDPDLHSRLGQPGRLPLLTRLMAVMWDFQHV